MAKNWGGSGAISGSALKTILYRDSCNTRKHPSSLISQNVFINGDMAYLYRQHRVRPSMQESKPFGSWKQALFCLEACRSECSRWLRFITCSASQPGDHSTVYSSAEKRKPGSACSAPRFLTDFGKVDQETFPNIYCQPSS